PRVLEWPDRAASVVDLRHQRQGANEPAPARTRSARGSRRPARRRQRCVPRGALSALPRARALRLAALLRLRRLARLALLRAGFRLRARLRHRPAADRALRHHVTSRRAVLAAEVDDLKMDRVPAIARKQVLEVGLDLLDVARARQSPPRGEPEDVRI